MEVKIKVDDLKELWGDRGGKDYYYQKLCEIKRAFDANKLDEIKKVLETVSLLGA